MSTMGNYFGEVTEETPTEPTGRVSVYTMIQYVDHTGRQRFRRVSLYTEYGASATAAKGIVKNMRDNNPSLNNVGGRLVIDL